MVIISNMKKKPDECMACPLCSYEDDSCLINSKYYDTWEDQYRDCPLIEKNET